MVVGAGSPRAVRQKGLTVEGRGSSHRRMAGGERRTSDGDGPSSPARQQRAPPRERSHEGRDPRAQRERRQSPTGAAAVSPSRARSRAEREARRQQRAPRAGPSPSSRAGSSSAAGARASRRGRLALSGVAWVCDDDFATRSLLSSLLRRQGLRVEAFADGQDAVDRMRTLLAEDAGRAADGEDGGATCPAASSLPRLLVVDGSMPRLGGVGTLAAVRALRAEASSLGVVGVVSALDELRAIAVTGDATSEGRRAFLEAGASSVIAKPVDATALADCVQALEAGPHS